MKIRSRVLLVIIVLALFVPQNILAAEKKDPVGTWEFSITDAPYGYTSGKFEVKIVDEKYAVDVIFEGGDYIFEGEMIFFEKDKFSFSLYVEDQDVLLDLVFSDKDQMKGKVVYSEGELSITTKRKKDEE